MFDANKHKTLATLRRDGSPRISGIEIWFEDGELWFGSMWQGVKALDLQRDSRFALHSASDGEDFEGDYLIPGLVELHTDALEHHYKPRPGVRWNPIAAVQAHDAQVATSGITTVFDAVRVGIDDAGDTTSER